MEKLPQDFKDFLKLLSQHRACYPQRVLHQVDEVEVPFVSLSDLRANKEAAGRSKDRLDLENLPQPD